MLVIMYTKKSTDQPSSQLGNQLIAQIGIYSADENQKTTDHFFVGHRVTTTEGIENLYEGIAEYKLKYTDGVIKYAKNSKHKLIGSEEEINDDIQQGQFYRAQFLRLMAQMNSSPEGNYTTGDPTTMENFLGKAGMKLYKLALKEEMNSQAYMNAVFRASTTHFEGEKWAERPFVIVAGPSGCGKTRAAKEAVERAAQFLPKTTSGEADGNDVVAIDGGVFREVSQMRKIAIQVAMNKGFDILDDLHKESGILEDAKTRLLNTVYVTPSLGVVLPETFSDMVLPVPEPLSKKIQLLNKISSLPNTVPIFCRVDGVDGEDEQFQETVALMGSKRALRTSDFDVVVALDLNNTKIPEFKIYQGQYFKAGKIGSKNAEEWFKEHNPGRMIIAITNDLIIKKEEPKNSGNWVNAKHDEEGATLISMRVFEAWEKSPKTQTLKEFNADPAHSVPILIHTSAEFAIAIKVENIKERIAKAMTSSSSEEFKSVCQRLEATLSTVSELDTTDVEQVDNIMKQFHSQLRQMDNFADAKFLSKQTINDLREISSLLVQLSKSLHSALPEKAISQTSAAPAPSSTPTATTQNSPSSKWKDVHSENLEQQQESTKKFGLRRGGRIAQGDIKKLQDDLAKLSQQPSPSQSGTASKTEASSTATISTNTTTTTPTTPEQNQSSLYGRKKFQDIFQKPTSSPSGTASTGISSTATTSTNTTTTTLTTPQPSSYGRMFGGMGMRLQNQTTAEKTMEKGIEKEKVDKKTTSEKTTSRPEKEKVDKKTTPEKLTTSPEKEDHDEEDTSSFTLSRG